MTALRTPRVIKVGTDFSGLDTAVLALQRLSHLPVQLCFCSDTDKHCKKLLLHFHQPKNFYDNAEGRKKEEEVPVDLYIAMHSAVSTMELARQATRPPRSQGPIDKGANQICAASSPKTVYHGDCQRNVFQKTQTCFEGRPLCSTDPGVSCFCRCIERSFKLFHKTDGACLSSQSAKIPTGTNSSGLGNVASALFLLLWIRPHLLTSLGVCQKIHGLEP